VHIVVRGEIKMKIKESQEGESPRKAQEPNKPEANLAWAKGGCVGA